MRTISHIVLATFIFLASMVASAHAQEGLDDLLDGVVPKSQHTTESKSLSAAETVIGACLRDNWNLQSLSQDDLEEAVVSLKISLKKDGTLQRAPRITVIGVSDKAVAQALKTTGEEALKACIPFQLPLDKYETWRGITLTMMLQDGSWQAGL